ncbi:alkanesulfonate monooxygenase SsuD/methylene tetrahydromethanopterin reductase-like flavin-dependent oxidoreductase (luciferase family) [Actinocorallia herbida]|uniref:Alkanesulfonate monooxygenase SsuD/methylene tetrahydromethanopterin reductase-like flavin-dependent oxidoreductase (Luciferase family) n=1 Tax=Actinocorallia herbida TaxID=58109 RepID=A0A3N1D643_9ACTN|nr:LLM class flavin-dependent oxidoreductase [Actinocorallia herbida]ROO89005.1 alkanesulfonate monooxygenase SsuD/methylene tetrahydromethanopterin reductase-like flavin-dependent oxidoreductase (luciferase family) [Actinocorallia herbida]
MELGLITFGSLLPDPHTGATASQHARIEDVIRGGRDAEEFGFSWYAVGEHHFGDRDVISSPALVLAALARETSTIRLATGTTLVANRDPVLVAEDYATLDLLSGGRLEIVAGGSFFPEPYRVFGQEPESKAARKRENVELLLRLWTEERVTWSGSFRPPLEDVRLQPRLFQDRPPLWMSGGTGLESVELAAEHGLPLILGTTARPAADFVPVFDAYRDRARERGGAPGRLGAASHVFVAETSQRARAVWREYVEAYVNVPGSPVRDFDFDAYVGPDGPALCGSPDEVVDRLGRLREQWGHDLHLLAVDIGGLPYDLVRDTAELLGDQVLPQVRGLARA